MTEVRKSCGKNWKRLEKPSVLDTIPTVFPFPFDRFPMTSSFLTPSLEATQKGEGDRKDMTGDRNQGWAGAEK